MTFYLYLWSIVDGIIGASALAATIGTLGSIALGIAVAVYRSNPRRTDREELEYAEVKRWFPRAVAVMIIGVLITVITPSKSSLATLYVVPKIANSEMMEEVAKDLPEIYRLGVDTLKKELSKESTD